MGAARLKHGKLKSVTLNDKRGEVIERYKAGVLVDQRPPIIHGPRPVGLGDLIATFAQPIAWAIDQVIDRFLTEDDRGYLQHCSACAQRHAKGNLKCPDIRTCPFLGRLIALLPDAAREALLAAVAKHAKPAA